MNSCHEEGIRDRNRAGVKFARDRHVLVKQTGGTPQGVKRVGCGCIRRNTVTWGVAASGIWQKVEMGEMGVKWVTYLHVSSTQTSPSACTQSLLCPRFGQVRVFCMRARDVPGHSPMNLSGLVPCSVAWARRSLWRLGE
eukprot:gene26254-biopygen15330